MPTIGRRTRWPIPFMVRRSSRQSSDAVPMIVRGTRPSYGGAARGVPPAGGGSAHPDGVLPTRSGLRSPRNALTARTGLIMDAPHRQTGRRMGIDVEAIVSGRRMRRNRRTDWSRRLVRETRLSVDDLIWPLFITEGVDRRDAVPSMPGAFRLSVDQAVSEARRAADLGIPMVALFPYTDPGLRDEVGSEALNPDNLICRAVRAIRAAVPDLGLMVDVALDPYTSHGHDGL
eukprot:gene27433-30324_t